MGNTASSTVPAAEVLRVIASEEKERGEPAPATDQSVPGDEELRAGLLLLGVDIGDTPMAGEKPIDVWVMRRCHSRRKYKETHVQQW